MSGAATRAAKRTLAAAALSAAALLATPASAAPGDMQFATVTNHDPSAFLRALRAGGDFVKAGRGRRFRVILGNSGVIVAIPGASTVQRELVQSRRAGLEIIACKETIDALSKANKRRIPVVPGVTVQKCESLRNKMTVSGWQTAPGF